MEKIVFYILAMIMIVFAVMSVTSRNVMRAIVFLLFVMLGLAGIYFMIDFFFLAAVQMTVYAGGIIILYITSIMLVERIGEPLDKPKPIHQYIAGGIASLGAGMSLFAIYNYDFDQVTEETTTTIADVGRTLLNYGDGGYILPFEVISILLLAAMVGAIVIAKSYQKKESSN
ncbi:MAG: NADH-quinone oxidoreductase subunit J [Bacteroidales bacterium]|nr:NADH-quinone oxidoreductase subunit J [Bacteroidales bacterium]